MKQLATPLLLAALVCGAATAAAQTTFRLGVRGGLNRALTTMPSVEYLSGGPAYSVDKSAIYSWQAGLVLDARFHNFAFQPALLFSQKGEKLATNASLGGINGTTTLQTTSTNRYNWLEIPLNIVYTRHGDHGFQVFAGPYAALGVGGHQTGTSYLSAPNIFSVPYTFKNRVTYGSDTNNRRFDAGVNFGVGYRQGPVQVQAGFGLGFVNLHRELPTIDPGFSPLTAHNFYNDAAYNRVAQLTGTYFFSL